MKKRFIFCSFAMAVVVFCSSMSKGVSPYDNIANAFPNVHENIEKCFVSFDSQGGSFVQPICTFKNTKIGSLPIPYKENCAFVGWYLNGTKIDENYLLSDDLKLTAKWSNDLTCDLSFESNGGNRIEPMRFTIGDKISHLPSCEREGYVFKGWYFDPNCTLERVHLPYTIVADTTIYAGWYASTFSVATSYDQDRFLRVDAPTYGSIRSSYRMTCVPKIAYSDVTFDVTIGDVRQAEGKTYSVSKGYDVATELTTYSLTIIQGAINGNVIIKMSAAPISFGVEYFCSDGIIKDETWPTKITGTDDLVLFVKKHTAYKFSSFLVRTKNKILDSTADDVDADTRKITVKKETLASNRQNLEIVLDAIPKRFDVFPDYYHELVKIDETEPPYPITPTYVSGFSIVFKTISFCKMRSDLVVYCGDTILNNDQYTWESCSNEGGNAEEWTRARLTIKKNVIKGNIRFTVNCTYNTYALNYSGTLYRLAFEGKTEMTYKTDHQVAIIPEKYYKLPISKDVSLVYDGSKENVPFSYNNGKIGINGRYIIDNMTLTARAVPIDYDVFCEAGANVKIIEAPDELNHDSTPEAATFKFQTVDNYTRFKTDLASLPIVYVDEDGGTTHLLTKDKDYDISYDKYYHSMTITLRAGAVVGNIHVESNPAYGDEYNVNVDGLVGDNELDFVGASQCRHLTDYEAKISVPDGLSYYYSVPSSIVIKSHIVEDDGTTKDVTLVQGTDYEYTTYNTSSAKLKIYGRSICGDLTITGKRISIHRKVTYTLPTQEAALTKISGPDTFCYDDGVDFVAKFQNTNVKRYKFDTSNVLVKIGSTKFNNFSWYNENGIYTLKIARADIIADVNISFTVSYHSYKVTFSGFGEKAELQYSGASSASSGSDYVATIQIKNDFWGRYAFDQNSIDVKIDSKEYSGYKVTESKKSDSDRFYYIKISIPKEAIEGQIVISAPKYSYDTHNITFTANGTGSKWEKDSSQYLAKPYGVDYTNDLTVNKGYQIDSWSVTRVTVGGKTDTLVKDRDWTYAPKPGQYNSGTFTLLSSAFIGNVSVTVKTSVMHFKAVLDDPDNFKLTKTDVTYNQKFDTIIQQIDSRKYYLPDSITVYVQDLGQGEEKAITDFQYNKDTGALQIPSSSVTGSIKISTGVPKPCVYQFINSVSKEATCEVVSEVKVPTYNSNFIVKIACQLGTEFDNKPTIKVANQPLGTKDYKVEGGNTQETITIYGGSILGNVEIIQATKRSKFAITMNNGTYFELSNAVVEYGNQTTTTILVKEAKKYNIPTISEIYVTPLSGTRQKLTASDYTYDQGTGQLTINANKSTGPIEIVTNNPVPKEYTFKKTVTHATVSSVGNPTFGSDFTFTINTDSGYKVDDVSYTLKIDGSTASAESFTYTRLSESSAQIVVIGSHIIGDIDFEFNAKPITYEATFTGSYEYFKITGDTLTYDYKAQFTFESLDTRKYAYAKINNIDIELTSGGSKTLVEGTDYTFDKNIGLLTINSAAAKGAPIIDVGFEPAIHKIDYMNNDTQSYFSDQISEIGYSPDHDPVVRACVVHCNGGLYYVPLITVTINGDVATKGRDYELTITGTMMHFSVRVDLHPDKVIGDVLITVNPGS